MKQKVYSVSELNQIIKLVVDREPALNAVYVRGELSNFKLHSSGHMYMTLKDENSLVRAVMFKTDAQRLKFRPDNGMKIIALGRISVYPRDGQYQLYINEMIPDGVGSLYIAFEQLKARLEAEGLFSQEHKKQIPKYPGKIAVITSPTGAAIRDILTILGRRFPACGVLVVPVLVQGADAPADIIRAIGLVNSLKAADLIIAGRGGGSLEDLWAFNDEWVARAIFASKIPIISAVGHEPDFTIADFVADLRAATPSNAAELAVPDALEIKARLEGYRRYFINAVSTRISHGRAELSKLSTRPVLKRPEGYISQWRIYLDRMEQDLGALMRQKLAASRERFLTLTAKADAMSPLKVLSRGYAIAQRENGEIIKNAADAKLGDILDIRLLQGRLGCVVEEVEN